MLYSNNYKDNKKFAIEVFLPDIALMKLDFLRVVFAGVGGGGGRGGQFDTPFTFQKESI